MTLALCVTVLLAFGRTGDQSPPSVEPTAANVLGQPSPERPAQIASFVQSPHQHD
jgi:hypothetical protein